MKKEFKSLSDEILTYVYDEERTGGFLEGILEAKKVKEFIKKVKMLGWKFYNQRITWREYLKELDKLAGPKLITK